MCFISNLSPPGIKAGHRGRAVPGCSERQTKEQTHPNDLEPGAEGALQVRGGLSDPPSKYEKPLSSVTENNLNCLCSCLVEPLGIKERPATEMCTKVSGMDLIYTVWTALTCEN